MRKISKSTSKAKAFVSWLEGLVQSEDLGTLAKLRRGLMYEDEGLYGLFSQIPSNFLASWSSRWEEKVYLMVAALFSSHQINFSPNEGEEYTSNLGASLRRFGLVKKTKGYMDEDGDADDLPNTVKRRFEIIIGCSRQELFGHLRQIVRLLKTEEIPIDWAGLICDLQAWDWNSNPVQWRWSRQFYVAKQELKGESKSVS